VRILYTFAIMLVLLLSGGLYAQNPGDLMVKNIAICAGVENRQPVGSDSVFTADAGKLYCFTSINSQTEMSEISHVWFYNDKEMARINLPVKAKTWRTWSAKTILPVWKGNWRVEVQDSSGKVITSTSFHIK
jgi:Protein of unknown function (DUF2914)